MIPSIVRKLFYALIWLWVISIAAFWLSKQVPGDEILDYLSIEEGGFTTDARPEKQREWYASIAHKRGLDLPWFYFSIRGGYIPDSLYRLQPAEDREAVRQWIEISRQGQAALRLHAALRSVLHYSCNELPSTNLRENYCRQIHQAMQTPDLSRVLEQLKKLEQQSQTEIAHDSVLAGMGVLLVQKAETLIQAKPLSFPDFLPVVRWNGRNNQYHRWMSSFLAFQPIPSLIDGRNAWSKITEALRWTLLLNGLAFLLAMGLGCLIGIWSGMHDGQWRERIVSLALFALFAVPSFWLATLLILFFSSGEWLSLLPSGGLGPYESAGSLLTKSGIILRHLLLPVTCLSLGSLAYVSRQMKQSVLHERKQGYVVSLRMMGIREQSILRRHIIRNALFPIITLMGNAIPALLSGSLIIEVIFSIPGMGRLMYNSLLARDWPVAFPILMLGATVTVLAYVVTDIVYRAVDPRVKSL